MGNDLLKRPGPPGPDNAQHQDSNVTSVIRVTSVTPEAAGPLENWTPARVEKQLRKAAELMAILVPRFHVAAMAMMWEPDTAGIIRGIGPPEVKTTDDPLIVSATGSLSWLAWLEPNDADIVLARLAGAPWKAVCWRFGISRPTADRRFRYGLAVIAWRLNGHRGPEPTPSLRSLLGLRRAA